jgi:hypothetical protein
MVSEALLNRIRGLPTVARVKIGSGSDTTEIKPGDRLAIRDLMRLANPHHASLCRLFVAPMNHTRIENYNYKKNFEIAWVVKINAGPKEPFWLDLIFYKGIKQEPE